MAAPDPLHTTVYHALLGDAAAVPALVTELAPAVRVAIARTLVRAGDVRDDAKLASDVEATAKETFAALFEDGARVLRSWNELGEPSLRAFVRSVAARIAVSLLRTGKREVIAFEPLPEPPPLDGRPPRTSPRRTRFETPTPPWPPAMRTTRPLGKRAFAARSTPRARRTSRGAPKKTRARRRFTPSPLRERGSSMPSSSRAPSRRTTRRLQRR